MTPLAHHAGEDSLLSLLVFGGSWLSVAAVIGRARLTAARTWLTGKDGPAGEAEMQAREPPGRPSRHGGSVEP
jgi:hypothetical protein